MEDPIERHGLVKHMTKYYPRVDHVNRYFVSRLTIARHRGAEKTGEFEQVWLHSTLPPGRSKPNVHEALRGAKQKLLTQRREASGQKGHEGCSATWPIASQPWCSPAHWDTLRRQTGSSVKDAMWARGLAEPRSI